MKKRPSSAILQPSQKAALAIFAMIVGLFLVWKLVFASPQAAPPNPTYSEAKQEAAVIRPKLPDGPRLAVSKGHYGLSDRAAAVEFSKEYDLAVGHGVDKFVTATNALHARLQQDGRGFTFSRDCVVRLSGNVIMGKFERVHEAFVEDAEDAEASAIWIEEKYLMDNTTITGARILTGFYIFRGDENASIGGALITDLREMLFALYEGQIPREEAKRCVFMPEAQCSSRIEYVLNDYLICAVMGGGAQPFAMKRDGSEKDPFSGEAVRYVEHKSFTTRNGTVRVIPVFEKTPAIKAKRAFEDWQEKAFQPNEGGSLEEGQ